MRADLDSLRSNVERLRSEVLDHRFKAVPADAFGRTVAEHLATDPTLDDFGTPLMSVDRSAVEENVTAMAEWCESHGVELAPHGKTTMAPALFLQQLAAGAWAITVANEPQLRVARAFGVPRVQLANTLLRPQGLRWLAGELSDDPGFEFVGWVDSVAAVRQMDEALAAGSFARPLDMCVEVGAMGGRTGVRDVETGMQVARAVRSARSLRLIGVSGYEGILVHGTSVDELAQIDAFLDVMLRLHRAIENHYETDEVILTAGGSVYFDRVVDRLVAAAGRPAKVVLRSGAYIAHDDGHYRSSTPAARGTGPVLRSAIHAWATVLSRPEAELALLDVGRRDVPADEGLPQPQRVRRGGDASGRRAPMAISLDDTRIFALNDQHAYARVPADSPLAIGDVVRLGLSHPCTAFDKWTLIPVLDSADASSPRVVDLLRTFF